MMYVLPPERVVAHESSQCGHPGGSSRQGGQWAGEGGRGADALKAEEPRDWREDNGKVCEHSRGKKGR